MRYFLIFFCFLFLFTSTPCKGEPPFTLKPVSDIILLGAGTITGASAYFLFDQNKSLVAENISNLSYNNINAFDKRAVDNWSPAANDLSEAAMFLSLSAMLPLVANSEARSDALIIGVMSAEMLIWAVSMPQLLKVTTSRNRPYVYNENVDIEYKLESRATESFFSRTTTVAFASAVFSASLFDAYYPDSPYSKTVWVSSLAFASIAGYLKFHSGQHFTTDVLTGALAGSLIGWFIPYVHRTDRMNNNNTSFGIFPAKDGLKATMVVKF